jgi:hypothetical protein
MMLVVPANFAVLPADLPVLFGILDNSSLAGIKHGKKGVRLMDMRFFN